MAEDQSLMNALEELRARHRQYRVHKALLSIDEYNYYSQEIDPRELGDDERAFLAASKAEHDDEYDRAVERLRVQEHMSLLGERLRGQRNLLSWQNWMGSAVVVGTGLLFWSTGDEIIAGAFVTLSSMFLQTMAGNFAGFFGGGYLGQQQHLQPSRIPEPLEHSSRAAAKRN